MTAYSLRRLRLRPGEEHRDEVAVQLELFELGGQRYLPVPAEVPAELTINRAAGGDVFRLRFQTRLHGPCMRCLEDAVASIPVDAREYHSGDDHADEQLRTAYVGGDRLALSPWAREAGSGSSVPTAWGRRPCPGWSAVSSSRTPARSPARLPTLPSDTSRRSARFGPARHCWRRCDARPASPAPSTSCRAGRR